MSYKDKLDNCLVSLDVGEKSALFIVLAADGTICRRGNGNPDKELPLLKGQSDLKHYQAFMMTIHEEHFQFSGFFEQTPIMGRPCKLMVVFTGPGGEEAGFKVNYGEDSLGPPREIVEMLINAVKITDPWYDQEIARLSEIPHQAAPEVRPYQTPAVKPLFSKDAPRKGGWWEFWK